MELRDRIVEMRRIRGRDLIPHPKNWRGHPQLQRDVLRSILEEIGIADALLAYYSAANDGKLTLIDGHERREDFGDSEWPVLITDLDDEEAEMLLATFDKVGDLAYAEKERERQLIEDVLDRSSAPVYAMLMGSVTLDEDVDVEEFGRDEFDPVPEMELQPYEHYDYLVVLFSTTTDWLNAADMLGLERRGSTLSDKSAVSGKRKRKIGLCRVLTWKEFTDKCGLLSRPERESKAAPTP